MKDLQLSEAYQVDLDENACVAALRQAVGKTVETVQDRHAPLSETEPDMYPCLLAMCGSGFAFYKVSAA